MIHIPVLQKEVLEYLNPKPNQNFIDCTIGEAGHTLAILEKNRPKGKVLGIEWDIELYKNLSKSDTRAAAKGEEEDLSSLTINRLVLVNDNFVNLKEIVEREKFRPIQGILFDLGMSSWHLEESGRGFSFLRNEPLDMRFGVQNELTAEEIVNKWKAKDIEKVLEEYGEERFAKRIAKNIVEIRKFKPIETTFQLLDVIKKAVPGWYQHQRLHFATKTFQALRIAVNDELENLKEVLPQALEILEPGGRIVVISFHSLEDRIVKNFFRNQAKEESLKILTKKPISPSKEEEIKINPRSRSAKLRAILKT
ncbi:MAG: 16S rRNA (cytosine(1402)-N(4))-methyltransferase RsmH [Candidatus Pacebacteria bacterium]|nr:16S rRNA (cytosine(1402)-N(4))-methyltransferase RsmH [Candidatus Paceibacterota bacterium]